jgi:poly(A) polymerase Pap1
VIAAITTNAKVKKMMEDLGLFSVFQQVVRILKYGFDQMLITGNKIGYFGGINIVLLTANMMFIS